MNTLLPLLALMATASFVSACKTAKPAPAANISADEPVSPSDEENMILLSQAIFDTVQKYNAIVAKIAMTEAVSDQRSALQKNDLKAQSAISEMLREIRSYVANGMTQEDATQAIDALRLPFAEFDFWSADAFGVWLKLSAAEQAEWLRTEAAANTEVERTRELFLQKFPKH